MCAVVEQGQHQVSEEDNPELRSCLRDRSSSSERGHRPRDGTDEASVGARPEYEGSRGLGLRSNETDLLKDALRKKLYDE